MIQPLIALDEFVSCCLYIPGDGWGWADETLSARLFRCYLQGILSADGFLLVDTLFFLEPNHCYQSWRSEIERRQLPRFYAKENAEND